MAEEHIPSPLVLWPNTGYTQQTPLGVVLIISPWNYPFMLLLRQVVSAMAAGNCVLLKPSEEAAHTAWLIEKIIVETFEDSYISVAQGQGTEIVPALLEQFRFDFISFTGSGKVGSLIAGMAARQLTPVMLELGGKSPAIVNKDVQVEVAAKRLTWGKFLNAGQTCVSPDYLLVHESMGDLGTGGLWDGGTLGLWDWGTLGLGDGETWGLWDGETWGLWETAGL